MGTGWHRSRRRDGVAGWLLPALLLHLAAASLAAAWSRVTGHASAALASASSPTTQASTSELIFVDDEWSSNEVQNTLTASSASEGAARFTTHERPNARGRDASEPVRTESDTAPGGMVQLPADDSEALAAAGDDSVHRTDSPTLSLDQLGIGATNPFRALAPDVTRAESANQRLQASLSRGLRDGDRQRGLGPEAPVLGAAHRLALASETLIETSAVMNVRVDAGGRVTDVAILQASNQTEAWRLMAESLLKSLGSVTLRVAASNEGFGLKLRVASTMRLPSGAAPGLRMDLLKQTLSEGGGPGSTSLSLSPTAPLPTDEVFDTTGRHQDQPMQLEVGLLKLKGDVADVATAARRVVQVSLLSIDVDQTL